MSSPPHKIVSDENWNQLMTLAAGFLALEDGDVQASMSRAIGAHAKLIKALKAGRISAELPGGKVTMFVPDEGGVALRTERSSPTPEELAAAPTQVDRPPGLPGMQPVVPHGANDPTEEATLSISENKP